MATFNQANQSKNSLKMTLSNYSWYNGINVLFNDSGYFVLVHVAALTPSVRKVIPIIHKDVEVKIHLDARH